MKINRLIEKAGLVLAIATLTGLKVSAVPLNVSSYSTTIGSATNPLYRDTSYSGTTTTLSPLINYSGGTGELTDGATSSPGGGAWVAWYGESGWPATLDHPTIVFDFGSEAALSAVSVHFWQNTVNLIRLPTALHVDYSNDGVNYGGTQNFTLTSGSIPNGTAGWLNFALNDSGRYARLVFDNVGRDTFISEIQFDGSLVAPSVPDSVSTTLVLGLALTFFAVTRSMRRGEN